MCDAASVALAEATIALKIAATVAFLLAVDAALDDAYEEFELALESLKDNADRQLAISVAMKDLWIQNQNSSKLKALCETIGMTIPTRSESAAYGLFRTVGSTLASQATGIRSRLAKQYNACGVISCDRTLQVSGSNASANAAYAFYRAGQRRTDRRTQSKRKAVQTAHATSFVDPGPIFSLMNTASGIDQSLLQGAYSHLSGAAAIGGMGLGALGQSFGNSSPASAGQNPSGGNAAASGPV